MSKIDGPTSPLPPPRIESPADAPPSPPPQDSDAQSGRLPASGSAYTSSEEALARRSEILNRIANSQPKTGGNPSAAYDDAYWAKQPAEVQKVRDIDDPAQRSAMVSELILKGYTIDVPIMLYGWAPQQTNQLRAAYGYTWVPSATMEGIIMAPGLHAPGYPDYDPNHPPPGAILVDPSENINNPFKDYLKADPSLSPQSGSSNFFASAANPSSPASQGIAKGPPNVAGAAAAAVSNSVYAGAFSNTASPNTAPAPKPSVTASPAPSTAKLVALSGETAAIPADLLSTVDEATNLQQRLASMGYDLQISEQKPADDQTPAYGKERRRPHAVGGLNVGIVQGWYARMKEEDANRAVKNVMKINETA